MTEVEMRDILTDVMRKSFRKPNIEFMPAQELREIFGIDSVQFVTLILTLEERFAMLLPEDKVDQLTTVQSLVDLLKSVQPLSEKTDS